MRWRHCPNQSEVVADLDSLQAFESSERCLQSRQVGLRTRANLSRGIREAKRQYSRRIAHRFSDSRDSHSLWRALQSITDCKPPPQTCDSSTSLLNQLNRFFACFEAQNTTPAQKSPTSSRRPGDYTVYGQCKRNTQQDQRPQSFWSWQHSWPCTEELRRGTRRCLQKHLNTSLSQVVVPTCLKATTIIPVQKKSSPSGFSDYRPVALTRVLMKCLKRLVMEHIPPSTKYCCGLQESAYPTDPSDHQRCCCGEGDQHVSEDLSWTTNTSSLGLPTPPLPPQSEKSWSPAPHHVHLLQRDDQEHPIKLHHSVVRHLHRLLPWVPSAYCESSGEDHSHHRHPRRRGVTPNRMLSSLCWKTWHTLTAEHCHTCQGTHPQLSLHMVPYPWFSYS